MPPWLLQHGYGDFAGELYPTDDEIGEIADWVQHGDPEGDAAEEPAQRLSSNGWLLGPPDLIVKTPAAFQIPTGDNDVFWNSILKQQLTRTYFIRAVDIRPSNPKFVHHANIIIDRLGSEQSCKRSPGAGFPDRRECSRESARSRWTCAVLETRREPAGMAWHIDPGNNLILNVHLQPSGKPEREQTTVAL